MSNDQFDALLEELKGIRLALSGQSAAQAAPVEDAKPADPYVEMSAQARQSQMASDRIQAKQELEARKAAQDAPEQAKAGDVDKDTTKPAQTPQTPAWATERATADPIVQVDERTADQMEKQGDFQPARKVTPATKK